MKNERAKELKYYGLHACMALWEKRPQDIIRVYVDPKNVKYFSRLLKWCAEQKKAYHIIPADEMERVSDSVHHEGVCILARELPTFTAEEMLNAVKNGSQCLLFLDGVQNPHNVGSIMRTAAHFGVPFILGAERQLPTLSPSACRIAKGAAEIVRLITLKYPERTLKALRNMGFSFISTSSHRGESLYQYRFPARSIIALGSESCGISKDFESLAQSKIQIPGSGMVESLNVSVATSLCLGEYYRQLVK